jgi:ApbE superfamily uncharacterized protein (UPF0280 family)
MEWLDMELDMECPAMELVTAYHLVWSRKPRQPQFQAQAHILQELIHRDPTLKAPVQQVMVQDMAQDMVQGMAQVMEQQVTDQQAIAATLEPQAVLQVTNNLQV